MMVLRARETASGTTTQTFSNLNVGTTVQGQTTYEYTFTRGTGANQLNAGVDITSVRGVSFSGATVNANNRITVVDEDTIRITLGFSPGAGATITASFTAVEAANPTIYPADRCTWEQLTDPTGYGIDDAVFYPGNTVGRLLYDAQLGFIGKSGRFVKIAN